MTKIFTFSSLNIHDKHGPTTFEFTTKEGLLEVIDINRQLLVKLNGEILFKNASVVYDFYVDHDINHFNSSPLTNLSLDRECVGTVAISEFTKTSGWKKILPYSSTILT